MGEFMEYTKDLLDHLNSAHIKGIPNDDPFGRSTHSVSVYDSIVVFERCPKAHPRWVRSGHIGSLGEMAFKHYRPQQHLQPVRVRTVRRRSAMKLLPDTLNRGPMRLHSARQSWS
jgi:hypothetical protein